MNLALTWRWEINYMVFRFFLWLVCTMELSLHHYILMTVWFTLSQFFIPLNFICVWVHYIIQLQLFFSSSICYLWIIDNKYYKLILHRNKKRYGKLVVHGKVFVIPQIFLKTIIIFNIIFCSRKIYFLQVIQLEVSDSSVKE